jgi:hypothetical protein
MRPRRRNRSTGIRTTVLRRGTCLVAHQSFHQNLSDHGAASRHSLTCRTVGAGLAPELSIQAASPVRPGGSRAEIRLFGHPNPAGISGCQAQARPTPCWICSLGLQLVTKHPFAVNNGRQRCTATVEVRRLFPSRAQVSSSWRRNKYPRPLPPLTCGGALVCQCTVHTPKQTECLPGGSIRRRIPLLDRPGT